MKQSCVSRSLRSSLSLLVCGLTVLGASAARAAECPTSSPDRTEERRALAKEWFARAEAAENAGNDVEAVHAYACSMRMVAHAFTAYNLGRVAERSGDLELALRSFKAYLTLKADAPDKDEVETRIKDLEAKVKEVKESVVGPAATEPAATETQSEEPVPSPKAAPKPEKRIRSESPAQVTESGGRVFGVKHLAEWVVGGVGVATLTTGIILNILARSQMSTANSTADYKKSNDAWSSAKTDAYTSYAMFGIAGAAAAVEGWLFYRLWFSDDRSADSSVSLGLVPGGMSLSARGRF